MKRAKCKQCGREAMVAVDYALADATLQGWDDFEGHPCVYAECAYCGGQQHCAVREEARHATYEADMTRRLVAECLKRAGIPFRYVRLSGAGAVLSVEER